MLEGVYPGEAFAPVYGRLLARLRSDGALLSTMDLLIAAAAVLDRAPLLTENAAHFERVNGLEVLTC